MTAGLPAATDCGGWETVFLTTGMSRKDGGPFLSVSGLAKAVAASGASAVRVVGLYRHATDWPVDRQQWEPLSLMAFPLRPITNAWKLAGALRQVVNDGRRDGRQVIVHSSGLWNSTGIALAHAGLAACSPYVISPRGMLEPWALNYRWFRKRCALAIGQRAQLAAAAMLHATSDLEYESIRAFGLRNPVCVIPNGLDAPEALDVAPPSPAPGLRRCVFLSRLHAKKGLGLLLDAWAAAAPAGWSLEIAGEGAEAFVRDMKSRIETLGLRDVRFVGEKTGDEKWDFLSRADLFVLPSYSENFGIAVAEAMAMGLPVITTQGTPWAILEQQHMGWWIPAEAPALAAALKHATSEPSEALQARGVRAARYAREAFGWPGIGARMTACYRWLLGQGPLPADVRLD
jgi:glycosyltransferase involved in cell wall biosynthesis